MEILHGYGGSGLKQDLLAHKHQSADLVHDYAKRRARYDSRSVGQHTCQRSPNLCGTSLGVGDGMESQVAVGVPLERTRQRGCVGQEYRCRMISGMCWNKIWRR